MSDDTKRIPSSSMEAYAVRVKDLTRRVAHLEEQASKRDDKVDDELKDVRDKLNQVLVQLTELKTRVGYLAAGIGIGSGAGTVLLSELAQKLMA